MHRLLSWLPRSWRMTPQERAVLGRVAGAASRRLKLHRNILRYGGVLDLNDLEVIDLVISDLDDLRA